MFFGSSTAYLKVAAEAAVDLANKHELDESVQFHIIEGNSRATPLQHGRLLLSLLTRTSPDLSGVEVRRVGGAAAGFRKSAPLPMPTVGSGVARVPASKMRRARDGDRERGAAVGIDSDEPIKVPSLIADSFHVDAVRFWSLLRALSSHSHQNMTLAELMRAGKLPARGVYFFIDSEDPSLTTELRVCRVGTHAVSARSKSSLRARLRAHFGNNSGFGNHRGSIFRLHVGNALNRRDNRVISTWGVGSSAPEQLRTSDSLKIAEADHELRVSEYIGKLRVLWIDVPDPAGPESERSYIERNAIALLAAVGGNARDASWLGLYSPREEIRSSKLWNLNYVGDRYDPAFLDVLQRAIERTTGLRLTS
jgi:hypothetical protein